MTIRENLNKIYKKNVIIGMSSLASCVFSGLVLSKNYYIFLPLLIASTVMFSRSISYGLAIRCPKCQKAIGKMLDETKGQFFQIPENIKCCPSCGVDFDSEI